MIEQKQMAWSAINENTKVLTALSDTIWDNPETSFKEYYATEKIIEVLKNCGFVVETNLGGIPTAFSGRYGSGKPVIGILGEYDALFSMSQQADSFAQSSICEGENGHGCGHNLLGVGSLAAAIGVKKFLTESGNSGTVIFYGCPGEESGSGKAFMARAGVFNEIDIALCWHPGDLNAATAVRSLANREICYKFTGKSSHAAASPHLGRSALDALTLLNTGVQFLREHIIPEARIHYAVTETGGRSPNVVQAHSEARYLIRAPKATQIKEIAERVNDVARGAALMTGTEVEIQFVKACADLIPNRTLSSVLANNLQQAPLPKYTEQDIEYAKKMQDTLEVKDSLYALADKMGSKVKSLIKDYIGKPLHDFAVPDLPMVISLPSSTDVGDVSWIRPTGQIQAVTMCSGTPAHSWQRTAQGKSSIAHKGMLYAGKVLAATAIDFIINPSLVLDAQKELTETLNGDVYQPIPQDVKPSANNFSEE